MAGINARLDALAAVVQAAVPTLTVNAPDTAVVPTTPLPVVQIFPWKEHLERTEVPQQWGNLMWDRPHAHGPDLYRVIVLYSRLGPTINEQAAKRACNDLVDTLRQAIVAAMSLPDTSGEATALDAGDHILAEWDGQGQLVAYHDVAYVGCYLTVDVQKLRQRA